MKYIRTFREYSLSYPAYLACKLSLQCIAVCAFLVLCYIMDASEAFFLFRAKEMLSVVLCCVAITIGGTVVIDLDYKRLHKDNEE